MSNPKNGGETKSMSIKLIHWVKSTSEKKKKISEQTSSKEKICFCHDKQYKDKVTIGYRVQYYHN